jgi:hypothetical protein
MRMLERGTPNGELRTPSVSKGGRLTGRRGAVAGTLAEEERVAGTQAEEERGPAHRRKRSGGRHTGGRGAGAGTQAEE